MEEKEGEEGLARAMKRVALLLQPEEEAQEESKKEHERVQEVIKRKKKSSLYSHLSKGQSFEKARQAGAATIEDYDRDREAEQERVRLLLQDDVSNELPSSTGGVPTVSTCISEEVHKESQILTKQNPQYNQDSTAKPPIFHQVSTNQMPPSQQTNQTTAHSRKVVRRKPQSSKVKTANQTSASQPVLTNQTSLSHQAYTANLSNFPHQLLTIQMLPTHPAFTANQITFPGVGNQRANFNSLGTPIRFEPQERSLTEESISIHARFHSITAMPVYENKSFEELRLEDYYVRRCGTSLSPAMMPTGVCVGLPNMPRGKTGTKAFGDGTYINTTVRKSIAPVQGITVLPTICDLDLVQKCQDQKCPRLHRPVTSLPYLWQVKLYDCWFDVVEGEQVEKAFCDKKLEVLLFVESPDLFSCQLNLQFKDDKITGHCIDQRAPIETRRLSTMSYTQTGQGGNSFGTQWRWYWSADDRKYQLYTKEHLQYTLETKYLANQKEYIFSLSSTEYKISFPAMTQTNKLTNKSRPIIRRPLLVTAQDVAKRKLPPSVPLPLLIQVTLPNDWAPWDHSADYELVQLSTDCYEYEEVTTRFFATLSRSEKKIQSVFRVQCPVMWMDFVNKEVAMQRTAGGQTNVNRNFLFHGTDTFEAVQGILTNNFDNRVSGKNATAFGDGVYFAKNSSYSDRYTKGVDRYMFLAAVLVGQSAKGEASFRRPPVIPNSRHVLYDSCVDKVRDPSIFVLFQKSQHYPGYLIHYKNK